MKYEISKQVLNTYDLGEIELYLKGKELSLNPYFDSSELLAAVDTKEEAWQELKKYKSSIVKSSGGHRLIEYVVEAVDEDGNAEFMGRADFEGLIIWYLEEVRAAAPKKKKDWHNGMVQDSDPAHVVKDVELIDWFFSKAEALAELKRHECYVDYDEAHEFCVENVIIGDIDDQYTWEFGGDCYVGNYPYVAVYIKNKYHVENRFVELFDDVDDANWNIDEEWLADNLEEGDEALIYVNMDGEKIASFKVELKEEEN